MSRNDREAAPRAQLTADPTRGEYTQAALIAARLRGSLHPTPLIVIAAAVLLTVGMFSFGWFRSPLLPILLVAAGPLLLLLFFGVEPADVRRRAARDYETYRAMMQPATVRLYADHMCTETPMVLLTDQYALMVCCVETPTLFVFVKDRERQMVLPKRCLPAEQRDEITEFLRLTFVRRRRVMRNWLL